MAFLRIMTYLSRNVKIKPKFNLKIIYQAIPTSNFNRARIWNKIYHRKLFDIIKNKKANHIIIQFIWIRFNVVLDSLFVYCYCRDFDILIIRQKDDRFFCK